MYSVSPSTVTHTPMRMSYGILRPFGFERGDHLDHALALEHAAFADRARARTECPRRSPADRAGRCSAPSRPVALATAVDLDRGLGAVEEAVEHLRVEAAALGLLGREAVVAPHRLGRRFAEVRQPLVAAPGRPRPESRRCAPSRPGRRSAPAGRRRRANRSRRASAAFRASSGPQNASASTVTLTTCLPLRERRQAVLDRGDRVAGAFDDDVDRRMATPARASPRRCASRRVFSASSSDVGRACAAAAQPTRARFAARARRARGRRCRRGARPACAEPAPGTSSRTCRRRSGRCGSACLRRRVAAACA